MKRSFPISLVVHAILLLVLVNLQGLSVPARAPSAYKQKIEGKEAKILWYQFRKELPAVTPPRRTADKRPLRAETKAPQAIVSAPKDAPKRTQMVWTPAPELAPAPLTPLPNLLAIRRPMLPPPPAKPAPEAHAQLADAAPQLPATLRLPPRVYVAPLPSAHPKDIPINPLPDAPQSEANTTLAKLDLNAPKLPPRPFTAPVTGAGAAPSRSIAVDAPSTDLNVAIVGLTPTDIRTALPTAPSPATFSSGPQPRAAGATSEGAGKGLSVPDLFVRGPHSATSEAIAQAYAAPTSTENLRAAMRRTQPGIEAPPAQTVAGAGTKVSGAPDPRFNGRDVYLMAIQMPNLTSYSGSWLMWYASRTARETGLAPIAAPVAHRKVDPKYIATAAEERIEGRVQLACVIDRDGNVSAVEVVRGLDDRLNQSAREALAKWQFYPALRDGKPIDVDVLVEIPFKLAPRLAGR